MNKSKETEYTEVNQNLRHYSNLRFAQLTIFLAITGVLVTVFFNIKQPENLLLKVIVGLAGIYLSLLFGLIEESSTKKWKSFKMRARRIERELGFKQWINFPSPDLISATFASRLLMLGTVIFWHATILSIKH